MAKFVINKGMEGFPGAYREVTADSYAEDGSYTVFKAADGSLVESIRTEMITSITPG